MHVVDDAVSDDKENEVFLVVLCDFSLLSHITHYLNGRGEVGGAVKIYLLEGALVGCLNSLKAVNFWVEYISVKCKAVRGPIHRWWHGGSIAEDWNLLLRIVI